MCANFKPATQAQLIQLGLPNISFQYVEEVFPNIETPLLFKSAQGLEWRVVNFGLIPKWVEDKETVKFTYNARNETLAEKRSFAEALQKFQFGLIAVTEFYESKYINGRPQRWGVRRINGQAFFIGCLYEISRLKNGEIIRSASMISLDAHEHEMMREFHEPRTDKRCVLVIPHDRMDEWLSLKTTEISSFIEGFPVAEFECFYAPKPTHQTDTLQISMFD